MAEPTIIVSSLSQQFSEGSLTVHVQIYRLDTAETWTLEILDNEDNTITWTDTFPTDQDAWDEFASGVQEVGLEALINPTDGVVETIH